ncbi:MAG TPA: hypothetical protein VN618_02310 [Solirubrobacteraceae bacterium]|nr:hypothetical protein [Solirubrobacteraceae bacterium]
MRYAKTLALALLAILAISPVTASPARAAEASLLGAKGESTTKDNGTATFESTGGGIAVKCTSSEGKLTEITSTSAQLDELLLGCTAGGFKCTGLKDATTGSILLRIFRRSYGLILFGHLVYGWVEEVQEPVHFECLGVLTEVRGSVVGTVTNANGEKTTKVTSSFVGKEGKQEVTEVEGVNHHLESETGGSAFVESSLNQNVTETGSEVEVMY